MSQKHDTVDSLYRKDPKVYPRDVKGRFARLRNVAVVRSAWSLLHIAVGQLGRAPVGVVRFAGAQILHLQHHFLAAGFHFPDADAGHRRALSLFFFTAVAGRLWCGYACPQTVWTEVFLWMERWWKVIVPSA